MRNITSWINQDRNHVKGRSLRLSRLFFFTDFEVGDNRIHETGWHLGETRVKRIHETGWDSGDNWVKRIHETGWDLGETWVKRIHETHSQIWVTIWVKSWVTIGWKVGWQSGDNWVTIWVKSWVTISVIFGWQSGEKLGDTFQNENNGVDIQNFPTSWSLITVFKKLIIIFNKSWVRAHYQQRCFLTENCFVSEAKRVSMKVVFKINSIVQCMARAVLVLEASTDSFRTFR